MILVDRIELMMAIGDVVQIYSHLLDILVKIGDRLEKLLNIHDCNWCN